LGVLRANVFAALPADAGEKGQQGQQGQPRPSGTSGWFREFGAESLRPRSMRRSKTNFVRRCSKLMPKLRQEQALESCETGRIFARKEVVANILTVREYAHASSARLERRLACRLRRNCLLERRRQDQCFYRRLPPFRSNLSDSVTSFRVLADGFTFKTARSVPASAMSNPCNLSPSNRSCRSKSHKRRIVIQLPVQASINGNEPGAPGRGSHRQKRGGHQARQGPATFR